jgi:hypothetical protein
MVTHAMIARVLHRLQAGMTPTQIAAELKCARKTVRTIRAGKHPLQQQAAPPRCKGCGGALQTEGDCLVCPTRSVVEFKRVNKGVPVNPYEQRAA